MIPIYDDEDEDDAECDGIAEVNSKSRTCGNFETTEQNSTAKSIDFSTTVRATTSSLASDSTSNNIVPTTQCECYIKLCLSAVTLIFQLLRQWFFHKMEYCKFKIINIDYTI